MPAAAQSRATFQASACPVTRRGCECRALRRERVGAGGEHNRGGGRRSRQRDRRDKLKPPRIVRDDDDQGDREREQRAAAEREVQRRREQRQGCRGKRAPGRPLCPSREAEREQDPDCAQDPEAVPVANRRRQSVRVGRVVRAEPIRQDAREEGVEIDGDDSGERASEQPRHVAPRYDDERGRSCRHVNDVPLGNERSGRGARRPRRRERRPGSEAGETAEEGELDPPEPQPGAKRKPYRRDPRECERRPAPGAREVAAIRRAERDDEHRGPEQARDPAGLRSLDEPRQEPAPATGKRVTGAQTT